MKAMVLTNFGKSLSLQEVIEPVLQQKQVLVKVKACGVCFSDVKLANGWFPSERLPKLPHILGHEIAGIVAEVNTGVTKVKPGDRVLVYFYLNCGQCEFCLAGLEPLCSSLKGQIGFNVDGGYAEYVLVPEENLLPIPDNIAFEEAAIIPDAVATAVHAVEKLEGSRVKNVLVLGVGGIGLHLIQVLQLQGYRIIVLDISPEKLELAKKFGATEVLPFNEATSAKIIQLSEGKGIDCVFEAVGKSETLKLALNLLKANGHLIILGHKPDVCLNISTSEMVRRGLTIKASRAAPKSTVLKAIDLVTKGLITPVIGQTYDLLQANEVLEHLQKGEIMGRSVLTIS